MRLSASGRSLSLPEAPAPLFELRDRSLLQLGDVVYRMFPPTEFEKVAGPCTYHILTASEAAQRYTETIPYAQISVGGCRQGYKLVSPSAAVLLALHFIGNRNDRTALIGNEKLMFAMDPLPSGNDDPRILFLQGLLLHGTYGEPDYRYESRSLWAFER